MTEKEYRKMVYFVFPALMGLLNSIYDSINELERKTVGDRTIEKIEKKNNKTVKHVYVRHLTNKEIWDMLYENNFLPIIKMSIDMITPLEQHKLLTLDQIDEFIDSLPDCKEYWRKDIFDCFRKIADDHLKYRISAVSTAMAHCLDIGHGDGIMDIVNAMITFVIVNTKSVLLEIFQSAE